MAKPINDIEYIIVHCSDSPNSLSDGRLDDAATIHRWHLINGWSGIGYHAVILEDGEIEMGRPEYWKGAHTKSANHNSLGICLIGQDNFNHSQMLSLKNLLLRYAAKYPSAKVKGHYQFDDSKTCPNFDVESWWNKQVEQIII